MYHPRCQIFGRSVVCVGILSCASGLVVWCRSVSIFQSLKSVIIVSFGGISLSSGERAKFSCLHFLRSWFRPVWLLLSPGHILFVGRLQRCCINVRWNVLQSGLLSETELMTSYSCIFITVLHHFWYLAMKMFNLSWVVWNVPGWPNGRTWDKMNLPISYEMLQLRRYPYCPIPLFTVPLFSRFLASIYFPLLYAFHAGLRDTVFCGGGSRQKEGRHQYQRNAVAEGGSERFHLVFNVLFSLFNVMRTASPPDRDWKCITEMINHSCYWRHQVSVILKDHSVLINHDQLF